MIISPLVNLYKNHSFSTMNDNCTINTSHFTTMNNKCTINTSIYYIGVIFFLEQGPSG